MDIVEQPVGRRARNKQRVRDRLYSSALEVIMEKGYDHASVDEIAERADVARGTFFNYFPRKEDLIGAWAEQRRESIKAAVGETAPAHCPSAQSQLAQYMKALGRINDAEEDLTVAMLTAWVRAGRPLFEDPHLAKLFEVVVENGQKTGEFSRNVSAERVSHALRDLYLGALYEWARSSPASRHPPLEHRLQEIVTLLVDGIAAAPTRLEE
ncbi:TetR/AcrR family transcriptional regulator [Streptomyces sp. NPDC060184]|uniref:TetR/AcrR family transcriptional regulator n=1 Tax=Streptomyces sp. NPDC060184 TaxID=3347064 RepID=UPI003659347E